mmetsp:Transcript_135991/g.254131  ORF Transcript_135991/g.254131 Transcript_135991/m.254131 type:complete len:490 (-) Transcript_135991:25-1494(-)
MEISVDEGLPTGEEQPDAVEPPISPYSVARHRAKKQLEAAAECNNLELSIPRLAHALAGASQVGLEGLDEYQDSLAQIQRRKEAEDANVVTTSSLRVPSKVAPTLKTITPRALPISPKQVTERIEAGAKGSVAMLVLGDDGLAVLFDIMEPTVAVASIKVFHPEMLHAGLAHAVLQRGSRAQGLPPGIFDHDALQEFLEDPALPYARIVAMIDPLCPGGQLLASEFLRHGPRPPVNSVVCAVPASTTDASYAGLGFAPLSVALCLGGEVLGMGLGASGCIFRRAVALVERSLAYANGWPHGIAHVAVQAARLGAEVEERPSQKGRWLFEPPVEDEPEPKEAEPAEGEEGAEAAEPAEPAEGEEAAEAKPAEGEGDGEPEKLSTAVDIHTWLFAGLKQCYESEELVTQLCGAGVLETEARSCLDWLAKTEEAGYWGRIQGVCAERIRTMEEEVQARLQARKEERRRLRAEKKAAEAAAAEGAEGEAEEEG